MKLAISGKGGVGKSTVAAALALSLADKGHRVLAVDADPDANLAAALGVPRDIQNAIVPISEQMALIEERTGAKVKQYGQMFRLNPKVDDIAERYAVEHRGVALIVLGAIEKGGSGCACPESVLIRALVSDLVLYKNETLIMDMEAGVEHLGRATARGVDAMLVVVEPGQRSIDSAQRVQRMAGEIGLNRLVYVGNKITHPDDEMFIRAALPDHEFVGMLPYSESLRRSDRDGVSVLDLVEPDLKRQFVDILGRVSDSF
ncbi:AAA family ATPase [candidate division KSB1 bacterium]|nr:AAA family ATPase [candidate division KSB1 bacterium]